MVSPQMPGTALAGLESEPVSSLKGVGPGRALVFDRWSVRTVADLAHLEEPTLAAILASDGSKQAAGLRALARLLAQPVPILPPGPAADTPVFDLVGLSPARLRRELGEGVLENKASEELAGAIAVVYAILKAGRVRRLTVGELTSNREEDDPE